MALVLRDLAIGLIVDDTDTPRVVFDTHDWEDFLAISNRGRPLVNRDVPRGAGLVEAGVAGQEDGAAAQPAQRLRPGHGRTCGPGDVLDAHLGEPPGGCRWGRQHPGSHPLRTTDN
jgi:hypothetical protein